MPILHIQNIQLSHNNFYISINDLNLENDQFDTSKRRLTAILIFLIKYFNKQLIIRSLKRDNQLHLFRRFEKCSLKVVRCESSIEFLVRLCQNFGLTPTFARVDKTRWNKWKKPSMRFQEDILAEELRNKLSDLKNMKAQLKEINHEISEKLPTFRYICALRLVATIRKREYDQLMKKTHKEDISPAIRTTRCR